MTCCLNTHNLYANILSLPTSLIIEWDGMGRTSITLFGVFSCCTVPLGGSGITSDFGDLHLHVCTSFVSGG